MAEGKKWDPNKREYYEGGRDLDQGALDKEKLQTVSAAKMKPKAAEDTPPEGMSGLALVAWKKAHPPKSAQAMAFEGMQK